MIKLQVLRQELKFHSSFLAKSANFFVFNFSVRFMRSHFKFIGSIFKAEKDFVVTRLLRATYDSNKLHAIMRCFQAFYHGLCRRRYYHTNADNVLVLYRFLALDASHSSGVARIFEWGGAQCQNNFECTKADSSKKF